MGMLNFVACDAFWLSREREMPVAAVCYVTLNVEAKSASWCLPASRTGPRVLGKSMCGSASMGMRQD